MILKDDSSINILNEMVNNRFVRVTKGDSLYYEGDNVIIEKDSVYIENHSTGPGKFLTRM